MNCQLTPILEEDAVVGLGVVDGLLVPPPREPGVDEGNRLVDLAVAEAVCVAKTSPTPEQKPDRAETDE